jgi:hypothetical protein
MSAGFRLAVVFMALSLSSCSDDDDDDDLTSDQRAEIDNFWNGLDAGGQATFCETLETADGRRLTVDYLLGPDFEPGTYTEEDAAVFIEYLRAEKC